MCDTCVKHYKTMLQEWLQAVHQQRDTWYTVVLLRQQEQQGTKAMLRAQYYADVARAKKQAAILRVWAAVENKRRCQHREQGVVPI